MEKRTVDGQVQRMVIPPQGTPDWPRGPYRWVADRTLFVSIPFTWNLAPVKKELMQTSTQYEKMVVGGPATALVPNAFDEMPWVDVGTDSPGILQRTHKFATRTTLGCPRHCSFCAVGTGCVEPGGLRELCEWPNLPVICDNNLFAASQAHFDKVMDGLENWEWCDFNQGVDARLLTDHHAERIARIKEPMVRLALDHEKGKDGWAKALDTLLKAKIAKRKIRSYVLVGYKTDPQEAWQRCEFVSKFGIKALPQWYHALDATKQNAVTDEQAGWGWTEDDRQGIMGYYYRHRGQAPLVGV